MPGETIRILSDIHFGEHSSRVRSLGQLRPLFEGATSLVLNGDTLDTRPGPNPEATARVLGEVRSFFSGLGIPARFITGNHDPDPDGEHFAEFAGGRVFATHGDILFADLVPWGQDSALIISRMQTELASGPDLESLSLEEHLRIIRRVAASIPQRHQAEPHPVKFALRFAKDTIWPPTRVLKVLRAWSQAPARAEALLSRHRPAARFAVLGHTHRPGVWRRPSGATIINTGAYGRPFGSSVVDIGAGMLVVRRVALRSGEYRLGRTVASFPLVP